jgi:two-component system, OmpR family, phosphate regulon response regulator PhoB
MALRILIVEDERDLIDVLEYNLKREGYAVDSATNGEDALRRIDVAPPPDLVLLDLMLPDMSGVEICRHLRNDRRTRAVPVIMLTAKGEEIDRVVGFEVGADDYVVKPFSIRELLLRIKAILRRVSEPSPTGGVSTFGCLTIDTPAHRVLVQDEEVTLTALEFRLLVTFFERKGRVQSREVLLEDVWDIRADVTTRTVDTHVKRLREKLGAAGPYIETVRGVGYRFRSTPE